jgi:transcriptional regulator with XRE-family HTH domain
MSSTLAEVVSANITGLRRASEMSQEALARKASLSVSYVSMLERGQRSPPLHTLEMLAGIFKVTPTYLLQEIEWPTTGERERRRGADVRGARTVRGGR